MDDIRLTSEESEVEAEAREIEDLVMGKVRARVREMAHLMASKKNSELLGATEFQLRDACHGIGAEVIDAALLRRKKGGTKGRA